MIHYITVHFSSDKWVDIQLKHIEKFTSDYKVWCFFDEHMDTSPHKHKFNFLKNHDNIEGISGSYDHATKLDNLFKIVAKDKNTKDDDVVIFLDSDAFPIDNVNEYIEPKLKCYNLAGVSRPENDNGHCCIHPCFTFSTVGFWKKNNLTWHGVDMNFPIVNPINDTGGLLYQDISKKNIKCYKIYKTKKSSIDVHPAFFSSYGDIAYHHGAGSRKFFSRSETAFIRKNRDFFNLKYSSINELALREINNGYFINQIWKKK
jgi:hypothetical protein